MGGRDGGHSRTLSSVSSLDMMEANPLFRAQYFITWPYFLHFSPGRAVDTGIYNICIYEHRNQLIDAWFPV